MLSASNQYLLPLYITTTSYISPLQWDELQWWYDSWCHSSGSCTITNECHRCTTIWCCVSTGRWTSGMTSTFPVKYLTRSVYHLTHPLYHLTDPLTVGVCWGREYGYLSSHCLCLIVASNWICHTLCQVPFFLTFPDKLFVFSSQIIWLNLTGSL